MEHVYHACLCSLFVVSATAFLWGGTKPGDVISTTDDREVNKQLEQMFKYKPSQTYRSIAIATSITAGSGIEDPVYFIKGGEPVGELAESVPKGKTGLGYFAVTTRYHWTAAVLTYNITDSDYKVAIAWGVGSDINKYWYNVKVYPQSNENGYHVFDQMHKYAGPWPVSGWEHREEYGVKIRASLTGNIEAKLMVSIDTTAVGTSDKIESHTDCKWNMSWFGSYCWRECHNGGFCWMNLKCSSARDCRGEEPCYESCLDTKSEL